MKYFGSLFSDTNRLHFDLDVIKTLISFLSLFATVFAALAFFVNYNQDQEKLVTDRFAKAIEQIANRDNETVRIGGIYSLERIAQDSPKNAWTIMEVLTSYIRTKSSLPEEKSEKVKKVSIDVQAVLTVIRRRDLKLENNLQLNQLELNNTNLKGANLEGANLQGANLQGANLEGANLQRVNLQGANLQGANLQGANLIKAILYRVNLAKVNLSGVNFQQANLQGAYLQGANLESAYLIKVENLTTEQVKEAENWRKAYYEATFAQELGLSSTPSNF